MKKKRPRLKKDGTPGSALRGRRDPRDFRRRPKIETPSGRNVRSNYEKECIAWLEKEAIEYQYEPLILIGRKQYRPDFFLPEFNLFLEICGYIHMPYYRDRTDKKEQIYARAGLRAVFIHYTGRGNLGELLEEALRTYRESK